MTIPPAAVEPKVSVPEMPIAEHVLPVGIVHIVIREGVVVFAQPIDNQHPAEKRKRDASSD